jgi:hypothetical protein
MRWTHTQVLISLCCPACGISYAVPEYFFECSVRDREGMCCPNGHRIRYFPPEPDPEVIEARRRKVLELHEAEQAEAKAADEKATSVASSIKCHVCGKAYQSTTWLTRHMRKAHGVESAQVNESK